MGKPNNSSKKRKSTTASSNNASKKKRKPTLAQHRKKRKELAKEKEKEQGARLVVDEYFEVEKIVGERKRNGRKEYKVRWRGLPPSDDTWEPKSSLCDTAYHEALRFSREQQAEKLNSIQEGERALGFCLESSMIQETKAPSNLAEEVTEAMRASNRVAEVSMNFMGEATDFAKAPNALVERSSNVARSPSSKSKVLDVEYFPIPGTEIIIPKCSPKEATDNQWQQADQDQLVFRDVERIDVNDLDAKDRVRELRVNGTPFVLIGHCGWAQFASRWLKRPFSNRPKQDAKPLDLSVPQQVDVDRMMHDIGDEEVPILKKDYNEYKPIAGKLLANTFIKHCWPKDGKIRGDSEKSGLQTHAHMFYLHQWQFPLSETAKGNLCGRGRSVPLPNDIIGEDLLQFYLEDLQDNPFQYIFMGHEGTMSKLHSDKGGLEISIAPIVGEKECVLVHRSDGENCLYDLDARIDDINLQKFPMMAFARVWKTVVRPGEILWMPQGTFHQCRNITPCLSYSR
jgi:hypothetical protein